MREKLAFFLTDWIPNLQKNKALRDAAIRSFLTSAVLSLTACAADKKSTPPPPEPTKPVVVWENQTPQLSLEPQQTILPPDTVFVTPPTEKKATTTPAITEDPYGQETNIATSIESGLDKTSIEAPFEVPVLVISYFPLRDGRLDPKITGLNFTLEEVRARVNRVTNKAVDALERGSIYHGYQDQAATPSLDYRIAQSYENLTAIPLSQNQVPGNQGWYRPDYMSILNSINICDYVDNQGVKEVLLWGYHYGGVEPSESNMAMGRLSQAWWNHSNYGDVSNKEQINDMPVCQKTYTLFNYNYGVGLGNVLENHTHQLERVFGFIDRDLFLSNFAGLWDDFGFSRCGLTHLPPNVMPYSPFQEYNWSSEEAVLSDCEDWKPDGSGEKKMVNCHTWAGEDCDQHHEGKPNDMGTAFKIWWMQNIPGMGYNLVSGDKSLINWWKYIGDFDRTIIETGKIFYPPTIYLSPSSEGFLRNIDGP